MFHKSWTCLEICGGSFRILLLGYPKYNIIIIIIIIAHWWSKVYVYYSWHICTDSFEYFLFHFAYYMVYQNKSKVSHKYNKNHWYYLQINQAFLVLLSLSHTVTLEVIGMPFIYSVTIFMASTIAVYPFYCIQQTPLFPCLNLHVEIHLVCLSFVHVTIIQLKVLLLSFGTLKPPPTNPQTSFAHITLTSHCSCPHNPCLL